jgi:hypothetical protein
MWAQSGPHGVTTQVELKPGPFGMKVPLKSSAAPAGPAKPTAAPATMTAAANPAVTFMLPPGCWRRSLSKHSSNSWPPRPKTQAQFR